MKITNRKQRRKAFTKFISLFIISTALITVATFYNFKVPEKENIDLREKLETNVEEDVQLEQFTFKVNEIASILDTINSPNQQVVLLNQTVSSKIIEIQDDFEDKELKDKPLFQTITKLLIDLQASKENLRETYDVDKDVGKYKEQIAQLEKQLERSRNDLQICRELSNIRN